MQSVSTVHSAAQPALDGFGHVTQQLPETDFCTKQPASQAASLAALVEPSWSQSSSLARAAATS